MSDREGYDFPYIWSLKRTDTNELTKQTPADLESELMVAKGEGWGQGIIKRVWNGHELSAVFKVDNQQGPLFGTWNSAQCYVATWTRGELGKNGYMCMCG